MAQYFCNLPIDQALPTLAAQWPKQKRWVIEAAPGAGKSTELPRFILTKLAQDKQIFLVQPRRSAAKTVAQRIANQLGETLGERVGYQVGGERCIGANTQLVVMTTGIALAHLVSDPLLESVECVLLDEFHERSWQIDLLYASLHQLSALREDLALCVLSATLPGKRIAEHLQGELLTVPGRAYPVDIDYVDPQQTSLAELIGASDAPTLVFLPGRRWIEQLSEQLPNRPVYALHSGLTLTEQQAVIAAQEPSRVILATNIAETSLTIDGITRVIDTGEARQPEVDKISGLTRLVTRRISRASADQRAGRAGRTAPGQALRCWPRDAHLVAQPRPEITHQPLTSAYLMILAIGEHPQALPWLDPPSPLAWQKAQRQCQQWQWLADGQLTASGKLAAKLGTDPHIAHLVLQGTGESTTLAAYLHCHGSELSLAPSKLVKQQLRRWATLGIDHAPIRSPIGDLLAPAFSHLLVAPNERRTLSGQEIESPSNAWQLIWQATPKGTRLHVHQRYSVSTHVAESVLTTQSETQIEFDWQGEKPRKYQVRKLHQHVLSRQPIALSDDDWQQAWLAKLASNGMAPLLTTPKRQHWWQKYQYGWRALQLTDPEQVCGDWQWLAPYLQGIKQLGEQQLWQRLCYHLDPQSKVTSQLPDHWQTPAGHQVAIHYHEQPVIEVKLQACFGLTQHPQVAGNAIQLNLCSPSGQPVAQTRDIHYFWQNTYPQVRKELRGRYNKHPWPEDPISALATMQTNRQLRQS